MVSPAALAFAPALASFPLLFLNAFHTLWLQLAAGLDDGVIVASLKATVVRTAREDTAESDIDAKVRAAVEQWLQIGAELREIAGTISGSPDAAAMRQKAIGREQQAHVASEILREKDSGKAMHAAALSAVQGVVHQVQLDQACEACWAARHAHEARPRLDRAAQGVLRTMISQKLRLELPAAPSASVAEQAEVSKAACCALDEWQSTEDAIARAADAAGVAAEKRNAGWVSVDVVRRDAQPDNVALDDVARHAVEAWVKCNTVAVAKSKQSVWNTSENATKHVAIRKKPSAVPPPAAVSGQPEPEPEPEPEQVRKHICVITLH
jgi:hypothetical protein